MRAKGVCERVTTRWPDSRTAVRKPVKFNGLQGRSVYEARNARISILAGRASSSRPDTLKQTDQPLSRHPPCRRGGPYVEFRLPTEAEVAASDREIRREISPRRHDDPGLWR